MDQKLVAMLQWVDVRVHTRDHLAVIVEEIDVSLAHDEYIDHVHRGIGVTTAKMTVQSRLQKMLRAIGALDDGE